MSDVPALGRLNHIGIVVRDLSAREAAWRRLFALPPATDAPMAEAGVEYVALDVGGVILELIEPRLPDTTYARFLQERGEGVHHVCFEVTDVEAVCQTRDLSDVPVRQTADGRRMIDLAPDSFGGVSIQLCQFSPRAS